MTAKLQALIDKAHSERDHYSNVAYNYARDVARLSDEIAQLRADKAELLAALQPLADLPIWSDPYPNSIIREIQKQLGAGEAIGKARALILKHEART